MDWLDLLAIQGTLKSVLQHHSSKASILQHSVFFVVRLSRLYVTTGKTIALTVWAFVGKMMSLLFNTLLRFVIAFLLSSKRLLILGPQSLFPVILEPKKIKTLSLFPFFPYLPRSNGTVRLRFHDVMRRGKAQGTESDPWLQESGLGERCYGAQEVTLSLGDVCCPDCDGADGHTVANVRPDSGATASGFERRS